MFETHAGAGGVLEEQHSDDFLFEARDIFIALNPRLKVDREIEQVLDLFLVEVADSD